jgi:hypothetical protein
MKLILALGAALLVTPAIMSPASAAGCVKGAAVGGVAGHFAGHHGLAGAAIGCAVGHHEANKATQEKHADNDNENPPK